MPKNSFARHQNRIRDHRHILKLTSHLGREWFHFAIASILAVSIIISALPTPSRADRVAAAAGGDRAALAVQQLTGTEPGNDLERARASSGRVNSSLEVVRGKTAARLRFLLRSGNPNFPKNTRRPLLTRGPGTDRYNAAMGIATDQLGSVRRVHSVPNAIGSYSSGIGWEHVEAGPRADPYLNAIRTPNSTLAPSIDVGRSLDLSTLFAIPSDAPTISSRYPAVVSPVRMATAAAVTSKPAVSGSGESSATEPTSDAPPKRADKATGNPQARIANETEAQITIKAEGSGSPNLKFHDGVELSEQSTQGSASAIALAAADFDSDGTPDLVTADRNGQVRFRHGNAETIHPNGLDAKADATRNSGRLSPFQQPSERTSLTFAPDFFVAGDFNADGLSDILATARGAGALFLLSGNGKGDFAEPRAIQLSGRITAFAAGEIGRADGQTDVAVAITNSKGAQLLVFETPEGAFKQKPEVFKLSGPVNEIAIGDLDDDFYADVVLSGGTNVTVVHGRGQAYPFDRVKEYGIKRPAARVENRAMPVDIAGLAIGRFTERRGSSLAILSTNGSVQTLETVKPPPTPAQIARATALKPETKDIAFLPTGFEHNNLALLKGQLPTAAEAAAKDSFGITSRSLSQADREKSLRERNEAFAVEFSKLSSKEIAKRKAEAIQVAGANRARVKEGIMRGISARLQAPLAKWKLQTISTDSRLAAAASSNPRILRVRVSNSNRDDLVMLDAASKQIQIVTQAATETEDAELKARAFSFSADSPPLAVLPMRLNSDALSDLIVLREGSAVPSVLMTAPAQTFIVTTADDSGGTNCDGADACSLRKAITLANQNPGSDFIDFNIPGSGVHTIHPLTPLPEITDAVVISARTQPGFAGFPLIEIRGDLLTEPAEGLRVNASNCVIRGFSIYDMPSIDNGGSQIGGSGIILLSTAFHPNNGNNIIEGNFLGLDNTGGFTLGRHGNHATGLSIFDSDNNTVGGVQLQARNVMSDNGDPLEGKNGVGLAITGGNGNTIQGNLIGTAEDGLMSRGNSSGVFITGKSNLFGGDNINEGNTVSGNGEATIPGHCFGPGLSEEILISLGDGELLTFLNTYRGNNIGTTGSGAAFLGNCTLGVKINNIAQPHFGAITQRGRNVVSGNGFDAIWTSEANPGNAYPAGFSTIVGNNIGTDRAGNVSIQNDQRNNVCLAACFQRSDTVWARTGDGGSVVVGSPAGTTPGGPCTGHCNLISGNHDGSDSIPFGRGGIFRDGTGGSALIVNNYIGTNISGTAPLPNLSGIEASLYDADIGVALDDGNGGFISGGNLISGNLGSAIRLQGGSFAAFVFAPRFRVEGNLIGTSADGGSAVPNGGDGFGGSGIDALANPYGETLIGHPSPLGRNFIAGNANHGIRVGVLGNPVIKNNFVGLNIFGIPLGNGKNGITASGSNAFIGGTGSTDGNFIVANGHAGVLVESFQGANTYSNTITGNFIFNNGGLGIDLTNTYDESTGTTDGVTPNDCFDRDTGANGLQNYPELDAPTFNANGTVTVTGTLRSRMSESYVVDFYASTFGDPSNYGEGTSPIGSVTANTDSNGFASFTFTSTAQVGSSQKITATATAFFGGTSEFSCIAGQCVPTVPSCSQGIVVNVTTDDADANVNDAVCDTDVATAGLQCSLRAAIQEANARAGEDTISFEIPGSGVQTITPLTALPAITDKVVVNGASQPGYSGSPLIEIRGDLGTATDGLVVNSSPSEIRALAINRFPESGIKIQATTPAAGGSTIAACYLGINPDGLSADSTRQLKYGVSVANGATNFIGGGNVIGNFTDAGVLLSGSGVNENKVLANRIGIRAVGSQPLGDGIYGVLMTSLAKDNIIGGDINTEGNLISGSLLVGIGLDGNANANIIRGNLIGTGEDGNASPLTHGDTGILIKGGALNNTIGGSAAQRNVIAGNDRSAASSGIHIEATAATTNKIVGNYIGINKDGNARAGNSIGVLVDRSGVTIGGDSANPNVISGNIDFGIQVQGETSLLSGITISNNFIGTDGTGLIDAFVGNKVGVVIAEQVQDAKIKNNTISGNLTGVDISLGAKATVSQNFIGTGASGETALPNLIGIAVVQTTDCTIKDNVVSGNRIGILVGDGIGPEPNLKSPQSKKLKKLNALHSRPSGATVFTERITVQHNQIGTNLSGGSAVGNSFAGIAIGENARNNKIGGSISGNKGNVISGQTGDDGGYGIFIGTRTEQPVAGALPSNNLVQGNRIGIKTTLDEVLPNKVGIYLSKADNNFIGGGMASSTDTPNVANIIGGNLEDGVRLFGPLTQNNVIVNNFVGVTPTGIDIGNEGNGVAIIDAPNNLVGVVLNDNNEAGSSNVIAANHVNGILIDGPEASNNNIFGNTIGIFRDSNGTVALGNGENGVKLLNVSSASIGGTSAERRNFISGNLQAGILISGSGSSFNSVKNNVIGTDENNTPNLGNGLDGVWINDQAGNNTIGGLEPNSGNIITGNSGSGVRIDDDAGCCNLVDPNSIYGNTGLGIDIGSVGTTANDAGDADQGSNRLQNYPEFTGAVIAQSGNLLLQYKVDSAPANSNYGANGLYIEFFNADASLQGKTFVGSTHYTVADYNNGAPGDVTFDAGNAASLGVVAGDRIVATATDADGNTSEFTSVNVGVVGNPTAVKLAGLTATSYEGSVLLNWQTGFEVDNLGFNVYREQNGTRIRITPQLIAGSALTDGSGTSLLSGYSYYWADTRPAGKAVRYWLEDIDLNGKSTFHGPYSITAAPPKSAEEAQKRSELISLIGMSQGMAENGVGSVPLLRAAALATVTAAGSQLQPDLATKAAVKIGVQEEGVYRVTQSELLAAGLDPRVDPRRLQLFVDGVEQPIKVTGEQDGRFDSGDTVEFFGVGLDVASTDKRVYWLVAGTQSGKRMKLAQVEGGKEASGGFPFTVERKDRTIYFSALRNGDAENFFGAVVASQPVDQSLWVQHLDQTSQAPASIDVSLQGVTKLAHNVRVQVNGTDVTRLSFTGQSQGRKLASISQSLLREGENQVRLIAEGGPGDVSMVDRIRISYSHSYVADGDVLRVTAQSGQLLKVSGFTRNDIRLMDVTDINAPQEIAAKVTADKKGYTVSGSIAGSGDRALLAFAESKARRPAAITANQPSSLRQPANGATMVIVTRREFFSAVEPLKTLRESQGLSVALVDIEDIYDEFSFGNKSPQAMRDFVAYAAASWQKKPQFVLFGGDASYDPRNYLGYGVTDLVPTKLLDTAYMETASDDWFSDFDDDGVAGVATGRLPVRTAEQMRTVVARLIRYEGGEAGEEVMLVSDASDGYDFESATDQLKELLPASLKVTQVNRGRIDEETAKKALLDGIHRKQMIVNYAGHGSVSQWRGDLLTGEDAGRLANSHRPVFVMMTCLNGYFQDAGTDSLGEALLNAQNGGAIAVWASSGMTLPGYQATMNQEFYRALFGGKGGALSLGEAIGRAKTSVSDADVRRTWVLLGDPSMRVK